MSSVHVTQYLSDHIDGAVAAGYIQKVKSHLVFCNACRSVLHELEENKRLLQTIPAEAPPKSLEGEILRQLKDDLKTPAPERVPEAPKQVLKPSKPKADPTPSQPLPWDRILKGGGLVAGLLLAGFGLTRLMNRPTRPADPVPAKAQEPAPIIMASPVHETVIAQDQLVPTEFSGQTSGIQEARFTAVTNTEDWKKLWKTHTNNITPPPDIPTIDFEKKDVIAYFMGTQNTGGYSVQITSVEETTWDGKPARIVHTKITTPPAGSINTMALTQPYAMKVVAKLKGRTFFRHNR